MNLFSFPPYPLIAAEHLPLTLISLEDWALVTITGVDSEKYLQGQVTIDINQMTEYQHFLAAHCNQKGKMWSNMRLFRRRDGFALIERRSLLAIQLAELKKYAIFSRVTISADNDHILLGIAGPQVRNVLKNIFKSLPDHNVPLVNDGTTSLLWFKYPIERFLLVIQATNVECVIKALHKKTRLNNSQQWLVLNIEAGEPVIDEANSGRFIPQAINLQAMGGISFRKGCYIGQEIITRTKFRGINKRTLRYLVGLANYIPKAGEDLELKIGKNWRCIGTVLAAAQLGNGRLLVQAVTNKDIATDSIIRVCNDVNTLSIKPLPYLPNN